MASAVKPARPLASRRGYNGADRTARLPAAGELFCLFYMCFLLIKMSFLIKNEMSRRKKNWQSLDYCNGCEQEAAAGRE